MRTTLVIVVCAAAIFLIGALSFWVGMQTIGQSNVSSSSVASSSSSIAPPPPPRPISVALDTRFFGVVFWGRYVQDWSEASELKTAFPFSGLSTLGKTSGENWIASLNCPLTLSSPTSAQQDETLMFNCRPEYLPEATKWFDVFALANSHVDNQGPAGFVSTKQYLDDYSIQYFGHSDKEVTSDICEVVRMQAVVTYSDGAKKSQGFPLALCGFHNTFSLPTEKHYAEIEKVSSKLLTVVYFNQGAEYNVNADGLQRASAREFVARGADLVVGQGAHQVQDSEVIHGRLVVYSMGNFIYDQQFNQEVRQSASIRAQLDLPVDKLVEEWLVVGDMCKVFQSGCETSIGQGKKPVPQWKFEAAVFDNTGKVANVANETVTNNVLNRLRWSQNMQALGR